MERLDYPVRDISKYNMFLQVRNNEYQKKKNFGILYEYVKGTNYFLHLPKYGVDCINEYLNCVYKTAFFNFLDAWSKVNSKGLIEGIFSFMEDYDLMDMEINPETVRRNYYRWKEKKQGRLKYYTKSK